MNDWNERYRSPYSFRDKVRRFLWSAAYNLLFRTSLHSAYRFRSWLLRRFGATIGRNFRIRRTALVEQPWNLTIGDDVSVGDRAILYALGPIRIGDRSFVSQMGHLCAGTHDYTRPDYPLLRPPIVIGADCWIAADAFVGPNVTIGERTVIGARSSVFKPIGARVIAAGNPAKVIKARAFGQDSAEGKTPSHAAAVGEKEAAADPALPLVQDQPVQGRETSSAPAHTGAV